jgi:hypothetical protein
VLRKDQVPLKTVEVFPELTYQVNLTGNSSDRSLLLVRPAVACIVLGEEGDTTNASSGLSS